MEAVISIELDTSSKVMPLFRSRVVKFTNREVLIESEQFYSDRDGERKLASYFLARPSMVALATGWDTWEMPARGPTRVTGELQRISEILQAAFPTGPATVSDKWQTVIAKVKEYVHPTGELTENKAITAGKAPDGLVFFYYKGVGEPMGPYQVSGIWNPAQPKPWSDNHLIPYAGISAKQRFETLGQVRAYVPAP
jgi:hypothetical protein